MDPDRLLFGNDGHKLIRLPTGGRVAVPYDTLCEAARVAAEAARANDPPDELRCRYKSTRCTNLRAQKRSGDLHNLCQLHRERANHNQRNSELRKRTGKQATRCRGSHLDDRQDYAVDQDDANGHRTLDPDLFIPEPLQSTDGLHLEPTYDDLKETAMLLSCDRDPESEIRRSKV